MDSLLSAAGRALASGDPLTALKHIALRDDAAATALRGIAMAQLGEHLRARELLRHAGQCFGSSEGWARARCVVAEAEVALAMRDFTAPVDDLTAAAAVLHARGDRGNALQARLIEARRYLLLGQLDLASAALSGADLRDQPPLPTAVAALVEAELAIRSLRISSAHEALARALQAAQQARVPALITEIEHVRAELARPAARRVRAGLEPQPLRLEEVAALVASDALVIDGCRHAVCGGSRSVPLARRPILFTLVRALGEAWPGDADRDTLIARAFRTRHADDTHRARLRVEIGRLRALLSGLARVEATARGFALRPDEDREVAVLAPPIDGEAGDLIALLSDGAAWSTSALALALGASQRTVQRALATLEAEGRVRSVGQTRTRRWLAPPLTGFTTILLLPTALPLG
jgi:hypothetical protein